MIRPSRLARKLFLGTTLLTVVVLAVCAWLIVRQVDALRAAELTQDLRFEAFVVRGLTQDRFALANAAELDRLVKELTSADNRDLRITLIQADGMVLADSQADPRTMESHSSRPEVLRSLAEGWGEATHYSQTLGRWMKYVAVRVGPADEPTGVVRVAMGLRSIGQRAEAVQRIVWTVTLLGLLAAVLFAIGLARVWTRPIQRITAIARTLSRGDLSARARETGNDELAELARSLNEMRERLAGHVQTIDRQRRTLESLLTQLQEGVVVAGPDGRILLINPAAIRMLGMITDRSAGANGFVGLAVEQCISQHELQRMLLPGGDGPQTRRESPDVSAADRTDAGMCEARVQVETDSGEMSLLARAWDIVLPGSQEPIEAGGAGRQRTLGRMLALTDVTELARTVRVKTDFASNASHELRTPLSAIRAAVETLMNLDLAGDAQSARQFLEVIDRHSNRMEQMVRDLLDLSRIESSPTRFKPETFEPRRMLDDLHARYRERLEAGKLRWVADLPPDLSQARANTYLLRLILDNLVDNAIKFTDPGGCITVSCRRATDSPAGGPVLTITVADTGCGIAEEEQERIFERFYQVEKARSGANRGTGLGLSIVRHAVAAMNGTVTLRSRLGEGTQVTVLIPQTDSPTLAQS